MRVSSAALDGRWLAGLIVMSTLAQPAAAPQDVQPPSFLVEEVPPDSTGGKASLRPGDRIVSYDGKTVPSPAALQAAAENTVSKRDVVLRVLRGEGALELRASPGRLGILGRPQLPAAALPLYEEGRQAQQAKRTGDAIRLWTAAATATREAGRAEEAAWLYLRVGEIHESQRGWAEARQSHASAWDLLKQSTDRAARSRTLMALGRCSQNLNDFPAAQQWYERALQEDLAQPNELWAAGDLSDLGALALTRGDLPAAENYHRKAFSIRERLVPDSLDLAASVNNLGIVVYRKGDLAGAQEYFSRVLGVRERLVPDSLDVAASLNNLAAVAYGRGDLDAAHEHHSRSARIREKLAPDSMVLATSLANLGVVAWSRGDLEAAHDYQSRALLIKERLAPDSLDVGFSLNGLGLVALDRGDLTAAEDYLTRASAIRERLAPDSLDVAISLNNLGNLAGNRGDLTVARDHHHRALVIRERRAPDSLDVATSLNNLGDVAHLLDDLPGADDYHRRALAIRERLAPGSLYVSSSLSNLGVVALSRGDDVAAEKYQRLALSIRERVAPDSPEVAETLSDLGLVAAARGDLAASQDYHARALRLWEQLAPNSLEAAADLRGLGSVALQQGRPADALPLFSRSVDIVEVQRWHVRSTEGRAHLLAQHAESYAGLQRTYLALDDAAAAFATAERARARSLLEMLTEARADIRAGVEPALLERERELQRQLNVHAARERQLVGRKRTGEQVGARRKELDAVLSQYQQLQAEIRARSPRYASLTQPQPLGLAEIQSELLSDDTLLLEYVLSVHGSHVFAVTRAAIKRFDLPRRAEIEHAARRVVELMMSRQPVRGETPLQRQTRIGKADAEYPSAARDLSRMILGPLAGDLSSRRLLIVADGALQYVPFGALPAPNGDAVTPLIVDHEIVSLPSASVVALMRRGQQRRPPAEKLVAVVADPVFAPDDPRLKRARQAQPARSPAASLPAGVSHAIRSAGFVTDGGEISRLPFTRDEADAIVAVAPAGQATRVTDFDASRATATGAELGRYRIVHLATHGVLDAEHPELSGLVLSLVDEHGKAQDGFLRLHEVYNLNWSADLVVLSACQTALGKEIRGEGLVGLTRGFMYAGAKSVLASLWNVNDGVTAQLMKRFYEGMLAKGLSPAAALRAAQLDLWKRKPSSAPYYWAAFVLQGEWH